MVDDEDLKMLRGIAAPPPSADAKSRALAAAVVAFDAQKIPAAAQASTKPERLTDKAIKLWSGMMQKKLYATPALATLLALPLAGYTAYYLVQDTPFNFERELPTRQTPPLPSERPRVAVKEGSGRQAGELSDGLAEAKRKDEDSVSRDVTVAPAAPPPDLEASRTVAEVDASVGQGRSEVEGGQPMQDLPVASEFSELSKPSPAPKASKKRARFQLRAEDYAGGSNAFRDSAPAPVARTEAADVAQAPAASGEVAGLMRSKRDLAAGSNSKLAAEPLPSIMPSEMPVAQEENRDRIEDFETNPVHSALETPVSTFSIDVDTASYSFTRRALKQGILPDRDSVRVEELINYFPYDWKGPDNAQTPFNATVSVMPTPWNADTKLMHVAIKGYDVKPAEKPKANLVFLLDVSGSMNEPDKLPLLQSAFRLLVNTLDPDDTVSIVTYAGNAGTVLEPTKVSEREKILAAIDTLMPGGSTAGEAGIREAYRLAKKSFVKDGVNRVMLATDGDFNVGQTDDEDLKRIIEDQRKSGVFLSVFGFGRGNLNDQMMQTIAQNGNGTAAYIDTLQEAEKVLVQDASSTIFPIAKDVKIQVEFNPQKVAEYRLIGYETRALKREDFNNDTVDAGEIGSGHSVTAIYEITPKGSPATMIDDLRYGEASTNNGGIANAGEYAFVKIRYKAPGGDVSKLITTPVAAANEVATFDTATGDQKFSVAVAALGQKLRNASQVANFGYDRIAAIATAARGADPFGYRAEFLGLVRLAAALDAGASQIPRR